MSERPNVAAVLASLGEVALEERDHGTAMARFRECLVVYDEMGSARGMGIALADLASLAAAEGQHVRALRLAGAAAALGEATGVAFEVFGERAAEERLATGRRALGEGAAAAAWPPARHWLLEKPCGMHWLPARTIDLGVAAAYVCADSRANTRTSNRVHG